MVMLLHHLRSKKLSLLLFCWLGRCCERNEEFFRNEKWHLQGPNRRFLLRGQVFKFDYRSIILIILILAQVSNHYSDDYQQQISLFPFPQGKDALESTLQQFQENLWANKSNPDAKGFFQLLAALLKLDRDIISHFMLLIAGGRCQRTSFSRQNLGMRVILAIDLQLVQILKSSHQFCFDYLFCELFFELKNSQSIQSLRAIGLLRYCLILQILFD